MGEKEQAADAGQEDSVGISALDDLQFILQETRVLLLQQILAHETGVLSVEELDYRNEDVSEKNIRYHLRELEEREIVEGLEIPKGERKRDFPNTFFAVTKKGARLLKQANLFEEIDVWRQVYDQMERTDRIEDIETMKDRPTFRQLAKNTSKNSESSTAVEPLVKDLGSASIETQLTILSELEQLAKENPETVGSFLLEIYDRVDTEDSEVRASVTNIHQIVGEQAPGSLNVVIDMLEERLTEERKIIQDSSGVDSNQDTLADLEDMKNYNI